jgi:predicted GNAT family acetyltransferase
MRLTTKDNAALSRYEVYADGELAGFADYRLDADVMSVTHTETEPRLQGKGVASVLVHGLLEDAASTGLSVLPFCPFVSWYIGRHPEFLPLVPERRRAAFRLGGVRPQ